MTVVALVQPLILVLFLLASLIFTGAQVMRDQSAPYEQIVLFPVVPLPGWVLLVPAVCLVAAVIAYGAPATMLDAPRITGLFGPVIASSVSALFFLLAKTVENDPGFQVALWADLAAFAVIAISAIRFIPEYDRRRRAGTLPEGYL